MVFSQPTKLSGSLALDRCPHCGIANPLLISFWNANKTPRSDGRTSQIWAAFACTTCGSIVTARCFNNQQTGIPEILAIYPKPVQVHDDIPEPARRFLQQAHDTLNAPDAAAMVAGSAVDAMLKKLGFSEGSVYKRIEAAVDANQLTKSMGDWAHEVRLGSNRPRHADDEKPHVSPEEAAQSVEFATALGQFLFVLTAQIERGIEEAKKAD